MNRKQTICYSFPKNGMTKINIGRNNFILSVIFFIAANCSLVFAQSPGNSLGLTSLPNLRDLGGYKTSDSATVRKGLLYRSNQLKGISSADMQKLTALKLKTDFDLRTEREVRFKPDDLPAGVANINLDVLADETEAVPVILDQLLRDPKRVSTAIGGGTAEAEAAMKEMYRELVALESAKKAYGQLFKSLSKANSSPALFHCSSGKDRTGWAAAALLTLLGVPKETVMKDFLRSNDYLLPMYKKQIDDFVAAGGQRGIPEAIYGVKAVYLETAFDEVQKKYGSMQRYFSEGLGLDTATQKALCELYREKK